MSGNTPVELIERLWMPTERTKYSEFGPAYINPDGPEAADQLTVLTARVAELEGALKPFADCVDQIADDEDDEEWAKFRLLIKDYRRARAALTGEQG